MMGESDDLGYGASLELPGDERTPTRRSLLGAAGGFALAGSGLLLPDWLVEETESADGPVRRVKDRANKRRQRRHHRLEQNRTRQRRDDESRDPGAKALVLGVAVEVFAVYGPLTVKFFYGTFHLSNMAGPYSIAAGSSQAYAADYLNLLAQFQVGSGTPPAPPNGLVEVILRNPAGTPDVSVRNSHFISNNVLNQHSLREGHSIGLDIEIYRGVKVKLKIQRITDSKDFKQFEVTVGPQL